MTTDNTRLNPGNGGDLIRTIYTNGVKTQVVATEFNGAVSTLNSSTTPVGSSQTYTGTWEDVTEYASITVNGITDATCTGYAEFSSDGVNTDRSVQITTGADSSFGIHGLIPVNKYFRVRVVNGSVAMTTFRLQTMYHKSARIAVPTSRLQQSLTEYSDVLNIRQVNDPMIEVALGKFGGYSIRNKFGRNQDIDGAEDVWGGGGDYTGMPTTGNPETITVTSSATSTDAGLVLTIEGLDGSYNYQSEQITLNGSGVGVSVNTYWRCNRAYVRTAASGQTANVGTLTGNHTTTTANVFFVMPVGFNQTQIAAYTVPANRLVVIVGVSVAGARANGSIIGDFSLRTRALGEVFRSRALFTAGNNVAIDRRYKGGILLAEKTDIKIRCESVSAVNGDFDAEFEYIELINY